MSGMLRQIWETWSDKVPDLVKAPPAVGLTLAGMANLPWSQASYVLACIYTSLVIGEKLWKWYRAWKLKRAAK